MKPTEEVERVIRQTGCEASEQMRERLWQDIAQAKRQTPGPDLTSGSLGRILMDSRIVRTALLVSLLAAGGIAVAMGVKAYRYHFVGRGWDGSYHFRAAPENGETTYRGDGVAIRSNDPNHVIDIEQTRKDLEETAILRQVNARELVLVLDRTVNGHFYRTHQYKYTLADGRTQISGESSPGWPIERTPEQIDKDRQEIEELHRQGKRELVGVIEKQVDGALDRLCTYEYVLADGRKQRTSEGDPELPFLNVVTPEQTREIWALRGAKQGEFLGYSDREVHGCTIAFETYVFTLSDGTVVTHAVGGAKGRQEQLTARDNEEFERLVRAGEGVDLDAYEEEIEGRTFVFRPQRFVLSDGSEVIWAIGKPTDR